MQFDANGRPGDETQLQATSCAELDALAEGRRAKELACTERAGILCGRHGREVAMAVDVITHESFHLRGVEDEAKTECDSLQTMAATAVAARRHAGAGRGARAGPVRRVLSAHARALPLAVLR